MTVIDILGWSAVAVTLAHVAHELTHYVFAWAFHREPAIGYELSTAIYVEHTAGEQLTVEDYVIHAAPIALGFVLGLAWLMGNNAVTIPMVVGWATYTLLGAPNDLAFREAPTAS